MADKKFDLSFTVKLGQGKPHFHPSTPGAPITQGLAIHPNLHSSDQVQITPLHQVLPSIRMTHLGHHCQNRTNWRLFYKTQNQYINTWYVLQFVANCAECECTFDHHMATKATSKTNVDIIMVSLLSSSCCHPVLVLVLLAVKPFNNLLVSPGIIIHSFQEGRRNRSNNDPAGPKMTSHGSSEGSRKNATLGVHRRYLLYVMVLSMLVGRSTFLRTDRLMAKPLSFEKEPLEDAPSIIIAPSELSKNELKVTPSTIAASEESADAINWNDSIFRREEWDNDPVVIESHKLLFFTVPKNSCTTFKRLFQRMLGKKDWFDGEPHNPRRNGLPYLGQYSRAKQEEFITSPDWTRAIFVRDPLERTLSAYMDKALHTLNLPGKPEVAGGHIKNRCCGPKSKIPVCKDFPLSPFENPLTIENFPFGDFAKSLMKQCDDPHWRPQALRMERENWKIINFVGHFETIQDDTRRLLERIGAYEEYGRTGWGKGENKNASIFQRNLANHKTGAGDKMNSHYTPELKRFMMEYYQQDYDLEIFNFTPPFD